MSFNESVFLQEAKVLYKVANNIAPEYVTDLFHLRGNNSNDTTSNLRSVFNRNFLISKPNVGLFKSSVSYSGALIWNSISIDIKNATSVHSFANKCSAWMRNKLNLIYPPLPPPPPA